MTPGAVPFLVPGAFLNKLGRGPLDHAHTKYQGSRPNEDLFMFFPITLVNLNAPVVATTSWWLHFSAQVVA